jgi:hypothetical protein
VVTDRICEICSTTFAASRPSARYCGATCRKRAQRSGAGVAAPTPIKAGLSLVAALTGASGPLAAHSAAGRIDADAPRQLGPTETAVHAQLAPVDRLTSVAGVVALALAFRIDNGGRDTGSAIAALARQLDASLADAMRGVAVEADALDGIRSRARGRRSRAG